MPIPDATYFGPDNITYGDVRSTKNNLEKLQLLKKRLDAFFISQIAALDKRSPFPLAIMSCIALETLGSIFIEKGDGTQSHRFNILLGKVDGALSARLSKKFMEEFQKRWPEKQEIKIRTRSDLIYSYLRNTLMHGYYAQAVYLNDQEGFTWAEGEGFLIINPHWLWIKINSTYLKMMTEALEMENNYQKNAILYINKMVI